MLVLAQPTVCNALDGLGSLGGVGSDEPGRGASAAADGAESCEQRRPQPSAVVVVSRQPSSAVVRRRRQPSSSSCVSRRTSPTVVVVSVEPSSSSCPTPSSAAPNAVLPPSCIWQAEGYRIGQASQRRSENVCTSGAIQSPAGRFEDMVAKIALWQPHHVWARVPGDRRFHGGPSVREK